jgi:hypothetical protein
MKRLIIWGWKLRKIGYWVIMLLGYFGTEIKD